MSLLRINKKNTASERGASMVEYAILVGLIVVICIAAVRILGTNISTNFSEIAGTAI